MRATGSTLRTDPTGWSVGASCSRPPPERVWRALTMADELGAWWGASTELDARAGGTGRFVDPDGTVRTGMVVEASPNRRLQLDWWPDDDGTDDQPATRVTIDLEPCPFGTVVTVTEAVLTDLVVPPPGVPRPPPAPRERAIGARPGAGAADDGGGRRRAGRPRQSTRRARCFEAVATEGPVSPTELAALVPCRRQAVSKHLAVLASAGLVRSRATRTPDPLRAGARRHHRGRGLADRGRAAWDDRLARLRRHLADG